MLKNTDLYKKENLFPLCNHNFSISNVQNSIINTGNNTQFSNNSLTYNSDNVFIQLINHIKNSSINQEDKEILLNSIQLFQREQKEGNSVSGYKNFIEQAKNHIQLIAPFIPLLTELIGNVV